MTKKLLLKILLGFLGTLVGLALIVVIAFSISPRPGTWVIRHMFAGQEEISNPQEYEKSSQKVDVIKDQHYDSRFKNNSFDIYYPKKSNEPLPVLIWLHGGGFVAGNKEGIKEFASKLSSDAHIAVLSMNYETAPDSTYPNQLVQVSELINYLKKDKFKILDLSQMMFGGDSAGSQIALQYVVTQTNTDYGRDIGIPQDLSKTGINGVISYCGPVNLKQMANQHSDNRFVKFFVNTVAWAELGTKGWKKSEKLQEVSLVDHLTSEFPATYITDGNSFSFQDQGIALENRLKELKVPVQGLFYKDSSKAINHEYQFDYKLKEAQRCYQETLNFVNKYKNIEK